MPTYNIIFLQELPLHGLAPQNIAGDCPQTCPMNSVTECTACTCTCGLTLTTDLRADPGNS